MRTGITPPTDTSIITGTPGNDTLIGTNLADTINGLAGQDTLNGGEGNDTLMGGSQRDVLRGGSGNDTLDAGPGTDVLFGGTGNDLLTGGGPGIDLFRIISPNEGADTITDFDPTEDIIQVSPLNFQLSGVLSEDQFVLGTAAEESDDRFIYNQASGELFLIQMA